MSLYSKIVNGEEKISLVGLGYVGMPIAVAFSKKVKVIGYDLNEKKIELYKSGIDPTNEVGDEAIKNCTVEFTADETKLKEAKFHIVAVPTPVYDDHTPDLTPVEGASRILGRNLTKGSIVVYSSSAFSLTPYDLRPVRCVLWLSHPPENSYLSELRSCRIASLCRLSFSAFAFPVQEPAFRLALSFPFQQDHRKAIFALQRFRF